MPSFKNIQNIEGSDASDVLVGDEHDNLVHGGKGDDIINGGGGIDVLFGGEGSDTFIINDTAEIADFSLVDPNERIDLTLYPDIISFSQLNITQINNSNDLLVINKQNLFKIYLRNMNISSIEESNFIFIQPLSPQYFFSPEESYINILVDDSKNEVIGSARNENFIIKHMSHNVEVFGGEGVDQYTIGRNEAVNVTLADFDIGEKINISEFSEIDSIDDIQLSKIIGGFSVHLPAKQYILIKSLSNEEIGESNFIFSSGDEADNGEALSGTFVYSLLATGFLFLCSIGLRCYKHKCSIFVHAYDHFDLEVAGDVDGDGNV